MPSELFPLTPIGMILRHFGSYFFVTFSIAYYTFMGSLFLASLPYELKTVDVP